MIMSHETFNAAVLSAYGSMVALGFEVGLLYLQSANHNISSLISPFHQPHFGFSDLTSLSLSLSLFIIDGRVYLLCMTLCSFYSARTKLIAQSMSSLT